jgi:hypothetical protein
VPTIPTPFIGGSDSPRREQAKEDLAPPFHPDAEEAEVVDPEAEQDGEDLLAVGAASIEVEEDETETEERVEDVSMAGDDAVMAVGGELEDLIHIDVTEEEVEIDAGELESLTSDLEEVAAEEFAIGIDDIEVEEEEEAATVGATDTFFPDFLDGSDGIERIEQEVESQEAVDEADLTTQEDEPPSSRERLAAMAEELREGEFRNLIRTLVDELGPYAVEIAIARAFAAGYLAAKDPEE